MPHNIFQMLNLKIRDALSGIPREQFTALKPSEIESTTEVKTNISSAFNTTSENIYFSSLMTHYPLLLCVGIRLC